MGKGVFVPILRGGRGRPAEAGRRDLLARLLSGAVPYLYVLPALVLFALFLAFPVYTSIKLALQEWNGFSSLSSARFVGFSNFRHLVADELFWRSLKNTVMFAIITTGAQMAIGFLLAFALWYFTLPFKRWLRALIFFPSLVSMVIMGLIWREIFSTTGLANSLLSVLAGQKVSILWFGNADLVMWTIMWIDTCTYSGYSMVLWLAGMMSISNDHLDAARIDGASVWRLLRHIVLPGTSHVASLNLLLNLIGGFQAFAVIYITTRGGPSHYSEVLATYVFWNAFYQSGPHEIGYASAIATLMVITLLMFSFLRVRQSKML